jgi:hypothetical protein
MRRAAPRPDRLTCLTSGPQRRPPAPRMQRRRRKAAANDSADARGSGFLRAAGAFYLAVADGRFCHALLDSRAPTEERSYLCRDLRTRWCRDKAAVGCCSSTGALLGLLCELRSSALF